MATDSRRVGQIALVAGLVLLIAGTVIALRRNSTSVDAGELRTRLAEAERQNESRPPQLDVAYAQITVSAYVAASGDSAVSDDALHFAVVDNDVARRITAQSPFRAPPLPPLLRRAAARDAGWRERGRLYLQAAVLEDASTVVGLLLSRRDPGAPGTLRLEVARIEWRDLFPAFDPTEMLPVEVHDFGVSVDSITAEMASLRTDTIEWRTDASGAQQFVPLYLLHEYVAPDVPANARVREQAGEMLLLQASTDVAYIPRRLFFRRDNGQEIEIDISPALRTPVVLSAPPRS